MAFPTTILSDSMEKCQTMHAEIKPVYPIKRIAGSAITARSIVADFLTPVAAIDYALPGNIIVADNDGVVVVPKAKAQQVIAKAQKQLQAENQLRDLMENEGLTCFQALKRVVGEITPTLGGGGEIEIF